MKVHLAGRERGGARHELVNGRAVDDIVYVVQAADGEAPYPAVINIGGRLEVGRVLFDFAAHITSPSCPGCRRYL